MKKSNEIIKEKLKEIEDLNKDRFKDLDKKVKEGKFNIEKELKILAENISQGKEFWRLIDLQVKETTLKGMQTAMKSELEFLEDIYGQSVLALKTDEEYIPKKIEERIKQLKDALKLLEKIK